MAASADPNIRQSSKRGVGPAVSDLVVICIHGVWRGSIVCGHAVIQLLYGVDIVAVHLHPRVMFHCHLPKTKNDEQDGVLHLTQS
jgi:hypothetical protein